ncbi:DUF4811 domain-containing protein [Levilactobacillus fujinensis]|uniref:DUF4811 domain-containing protein n=1 Tax=Levilactobacillus fujinensis TaxID=2486024 RepID=A0ABW1TGZ5_9LACO|nr:DUF4811 domain-containing protein [Levilactobacillus fujinensis]
MLLGVIVLSVIAAGWLFISRRLAWAVVMTVVIICGQGLLLLDSQNHYGTTERLSTHQVAIRPVGSIRGNHVLMTKAIKEGKTTYTAYASQRADGNDGKTAVVVNKHKRIRVTFSATKAVRETQNNRYVYTNQWAKWFFTGVTNAGQLKQQTVIYRLTPRWHVLTKAAVKRVETNLHRQVTQQQAQTYTTKYVARRLKQDPQASVSQLKQRALQAFVGHVMDQTSE